MKRKAIFLLVGFLTVFFQRQLAADITVTYSNCLFKGTSDDDLDQEKIIHFENLGCGADCGAYTGNADQTYSAYVVAPVARQKSTGLTSVTAEIDVYNWSNGLFRCYLRNGIFSAKEGDYVWKSEYDDALSSQSDTISITIDDPYDAGFFSVYCSIPKACSEH
jgi:hypothetical protein